MAVNRANAEYVNQGIPKHAEVVYYKPRSDFIRNKYSNIQISS